MRNRENGLVVNKSNNLIESSFRLTAGEQKVILKLVSEIKPEDKEFHVYKFKVSEFADLLGIKNNRLYKDIQNTTKDLMKKVFAIRAGNRNLQLAWLSSADYLEGEGIVELCFDPKLKPFLLQLKDRFTSYNYKNVVQLRSGYSIRIYELLMQYMASGEKIFEVGELRAVLGILPNEYRLYADFKRKVVLQARKELLKKTDIFFDFEEIKKGQKVMQIKFIIKQKDTSARNEQLELGSGELT